MSMGELRMLKGEYSEAERCFSSAQEEGKGSSIAKEKQVRVEEMWGRCFAL